MTDSVMMFRRGSSIAKEQQFLETLLQRAGDKPVVVITKDSRANHPLHSQLVDHKNCVVIGGNPDEDELWEGMAYRQSSKLDRFPFLDVVWVPGVGCLYNFSGTVTGVMADEEELMLIAKRIVGRLLRHSGITSIEL